MTKRAVFLAAQAKFLESGSKMKKIKIRKINPEDKNWVNKLLTKHWRSPKIISRGKVHWANKLPGFIAEFKKEKVGLITYEIKNNECEIITLNSEKQKVGVGTGLVDKIKEIALKNNCRKVWLITTNDNLDALSFYQKRGFHLVKIYQNALELSRKLKPEIPKIGLNGILLKDEIELEFKL